VRILHIAYQSLPNISGSSIRSRDIFSSQKEIGLDPVVITSPFQNGISNSDFDEIDGIKYYRTYNNNSSDLVSEEKSGLLKRVKKLISFISFFKKVNRLYKIEKPDLIHAHATFYCAFAAIYLKKKYKVPICYEVRSLWEEREVKGASGLLEKVQPKIIRELETFCMKRVDQVIVINKNLKQNLESRAIKNIKIVPNAVNISLIENSRPIKKEFLSFGYIGSVSPIEGLHLIAQVWKNIQRDGFKNQFKVYGQGSYLNEFEKLIEDLNLKNIKCHGSIDSNEIKNAFKNIDVIINPRIKSKISDTVTPLKPLEAMAYKKLVIASDVGGMKELITDKTTGILFEHDSVESLEKEIRSIITKGVDEEIITKAYNFILNEKSWISNARTYNKIYKKILL
jgi:glycosyltransferase involved in cell wall biosynthesis